MQCAGSAILLASGACAVPGECLMLRSVTQWHSEFRPVQYKLNCLSSTRSPSMSPYAGLTNACMSLATCLAMQEDSGSDIQKRRDPSVQMGRFCRSSAISVERSDATPFAVDAPPKAQGWCRQQCTTLVGWAPVPDRQVPDRQAARHTVAPPRPKPRPAFSFCSLHPEGTIF